MRVPARTKKATQTLANHEIVTLAVYLLGGDSRHVDTEDVAVKANEVAPGRFVWRKYPDQINLWHVSVYLSDAKKEKNGKYLVGTVTEGWLLSEDGLRFSKDNVRRLKGVDLSRSMLSTKEKHWVRTERARMLASDAYRKYTEGEPAAITSQEAEAFFRVDDYVVGNSRENKIVRILNTFGDDHELGPLANALASKVRGRLEI